MNTFNLASFESAVNQDELFNLEHYWQLLHQHLLKIALICILATITAIAIVLNITPTYRAQASILIEEEQANVLSIEEIYGLDASKKEYYQTQYEILRSRQIAEKVVTKLGLEQHPLFDPDNPVNIGFREKLHLWFKDNSNQQRTNEELSTRKRKAAVSKLRKNLEIQPVNNTQMVKIGFTSEAPKLAADVANTVAEVYIENYLEAKMEMTSKATSWLTERLQGLRNDLDAAESALAQFDEQQEVVNIDGVVGLASDKVQRLSTLLLDAQSAFNRSKAIYEEVNKPGIRLGEISSMPQVLNHPSVQAVNRNLVSAQSRVSELGKVYGPKHPKMITANAELASVNQSLNNQINALILSINSDYRALNSKVQRLDSDLQQAKQRFRSLSNLENQRKLLQREVDVSQQLYNSFFTRLKETNELGGFESAHARILDPALVPGSPASPKKGLIVTAVLLFSVVLAAAMIIILDALNQRIRSKADIEIKLGQRLLGIVPKEPVRRASNLALRLFFDPSHHHQFGEAIRTFRTNLLLLNKEKEVKTIMLTSSVPREGKTTVAINLAFALGKLKKVLLIETDLRRPSLANVFELAAYQPGLSNLLTKTHTLEDCLVHDELSNIDLLCAGTLTNTPQELLSSKDFQTLVDRLKQHYDHIVFDSAPNQAVSDSMLIAPVCDSIVYVVKAESTSEKVALAGLTRLLQLGNRVDGVVLNRVDLRKAKRHGDYMGYYDQYSYHSYSAN